jgi:predicted secreted protein
MKTKTTIVFIGLVMIAAVAAGTVLAVTLSEKPISKPPTPSTVYVTQNDNGTTISMKKGGLLNVTVRNYGDGGYIWTVTSIDSTMLRLENKFAWGSSGMLGDFGKDTMVFSALQPGSTTLSLECKRPFGQQDICQKLVIQLNIE